MLVAVDAGRAVGHLQLVDGDRAGEAEVKNMAVLPAHRGRGVGRALVAEAVGLARADSRSTLLVATASADVGNLRFYQRLGFRPRSVERDAFTAAAGYDPAASVDGVPLRDRVWLDLPLGSPPS